MKKLFMGLMVVGVLVSAPSLCGETWSLGKVTVDKLNRSQTGGLDSGELRKNHIGSVQIMKDVFGNNEVRTDSLPDVSGHAKAKEYCPDQCKYLGLQWNGAYGQKTEDWGAFTTFGEYYSHCGCTDIEARKAAGVFIDYGAGGIRWVNIDSKTGELSIYLQEDFKDKGKACSAVGQNQWELDESRKKDCKRTKAAQEKNTTRNTGNSG